MQSVEAQLVPLFVSTRGNSSARDEKLVANRNRRFASTNRFCGRQRCTASLIMKIFFLQKSKSWSPCNGLSPLSTADACFLRASIEHGARAGNGCSTGASCNVDFRRSRRRAGFSFLLRRILERSDARASTSAHQHFLKWDPVFFDALVYSE